MLWQKCWKVQLINFGANWNPIHVWPEMDWPLQPANEGKFMKNVLGPILPHERRFGVKHKSREGKKRCASHRLKTCIKGNSSTLRATVVPWVSHLPSFLERDKRWETLGTRWVESTRKDRRVIKSRWKCGGVVKQDQCRRSFPCSLQMYLLCTSSSRGFD